MCWKPVPLGRRGPGPRCTWPPSRRCLFLEGTCRPVQTASEIGSALVLNWISGREKDKGSQGAGGGMGEGDGVTVVLRDGVDMTEWSMFFGVDGDDCADIGRVGEDVGFFVDLCPGQNGLADSVVALETAQGKNV